MKDNIFTNPVSQRLKVDLTVRRRHAHHRAVQTCLHSLPLGCPCRPRPPLAHGACHDPPNDTTLSLGDVALRAVRCMSPVMRSANFS
jgi:hypothetical protein